MRRRRLLAVGLALVALSGGGVVYGLTTTERAASPRLLNLDINPLVTVRTTSGNVTRTRIVPLGGIPLPIDVDERILGGLLWPDVDVSVGLIAVEELPGKPIVPTIQVNRNALALARNAPAPPLKIEFEIGLGTSTPIPTIFYGYETPEGGLIPSRFKTKLVGPLTGLFIDPLEAIVETPGYSAPLKINAGVRTTSGDSRFSLMANPLPERIHFIEDPREDGLDFFYDHQGPIPDVKLDTTADLTDLDGGGSRHIEAHVERLPQALELHHTSTAEQTLVAYKSTSLLAKPDLEAGYRDTDGDGNVVVDANVKVAGLPSEMAGEVHYVPDEDGGSSVDAYDFRVLGGGQIDALDFSARNFATDPGPVPEPVLPPDQYVAAATRQQPDGSSAFRASGRLFGVRSVRLERQGEDLQTIDVTADIGNGVKPLNALVDLDDRVADDGDPATDDGRRLRLDTTLTPLPKLTTLTYDPARDGRPTRFAFHAPSTVPVEVDADALTADSTTGEACGQSQVTCLQANIQRLPTDLEVVLPGEDASDFFLSHEGTAGQRPDVRATVDRTPEETTGRSWADIALTEVPNRVRGRLDITKKRVVRAAEFHGCDWNFTDTECNPGQPESALGSVRFTVRDQPTRVGLPPRPDAVENFVSLIKRDPVFGSETDDHFEVTGRVDAIRHVVFHQRDRNDDGEGDGTLGILVDAGGPDTPFDVDVDTTGFAADPDDEEVSLGPKTSQIHVGVAALPGEFSACVRSKDDAVPENPDLLPDDELLKDCDETAVLGHARGELTTTPLSVVYHADARTKVTATVAATKPDGDDENRLNTTELTAAVDTVPRFLRTDVITPAKPDPVKKTPGRKLEVEYTSVDPDDPDATADSTVGSIDFDIASRRANSLCGDPRPDRNAVCLSGRLEELPRRVFTSYDPDKSKGDLVFDAADPEPGHGKLSINPGTEPFRLTSVDEDGEPLVLTAHIDDIATQLRGKIQKVNEDAEDGKDGGSLASRVATCTDTLDNDSADDEGDGADAADEDCDPDMARFTFDACNGVALNACTGIGRLAFTATNALGGDPLTPPPAPLPPPPAGVTHEFTFVEDGDVFRATGDIAKFKQVRLDKLDADDKPSETTKLHAAFGDGVGNDKIRAYVDRETGKKTQKIDAEISEAPQAIDVCFRSSVNPADVPAAGNHCEGAPADKKAIEASLTNLVSTHQPDIHVHTLNITKGGGAETLRNGPGSQPAVSIVDLADTVRVVAGEGSDVKVEGFRNNAPAEVAGRVGFNLQNFRGDLPPGVFPVRPLGGLPEAPLGQNFLKIIKSRNNTQFAGSVPHVTSIELTKEPCDANDGRFPPASSFAENARPEYKCVQALAAQNEPLDFRIRTVDVFGDVLSLDDAGLDAVPSGGFRATISKSPETTDENKVCETPADAAAGCRPPILSVEAPRSVGQTPHLRARLAKGHLRLLDKLVLQQPVDALSNRLDYNEAFSTWTSPGARVKLGKGFEGTALAAAFKLALPKFLDLDPFTTYSCEHRVIADRAGCGDNLVGADQNTGVEAKDIFLRLVGSDVGHGQRDLGTLGPNGRLALLVHDFEEEKQQILTGAPPADGDHGTVTFNAERPFPAETTGMVMPGYIDARVYMRDNFNVDGSHDKQQKFVQIDGRVNHQLDLAFRINEQDENNAYGANRSGDTVPNVQYAVRNAPCAQHPSCGPYAGESLNNPSFRVRAEVRDDGAGGKDERCKGVDAWDANFGFTACYIAPNPDKRWLNVDVNAKPGSEDAARSLEAVVDNSEGSYELRAFRNLNDKTTTARFSPQAQMRLEPLEAGFQLGAGVGLIGGKLEMSMIGDLIAKLKGESVKVLRVDKAVTAFSLASQGGHAEVTTAMKGFFRTAVTVSVLFGLGSVTFNADTPTLPIHFDFKGCGGSLYLAQDIIETDGGKVAAVGQINAGLAAAHPSAIVIASVNAIINEFVCPLVPLILDDDALVNASHPSANWVEPGRPIPDLNVADVPGSSGIVEETPRRKDLTINSPVTRCDTIIAKTLTVNSALRVGAKNAIIFGPGGGGPGGPGNSTVCDGTLDLDVDSLVVTANGSINGAGAAGIEAGNGTPGAGLGGGAGFVGGGAPAGAGRGNGGNPYGSDRERLQLGSLGRAGSGGAEGGSGGGVINVAALDTITVDGSILADGLPGTDVPGDDCTLTAAGGGSGGSIKLVANKVNVAGTVSAGGGNGGSGSTGGGGGGGGRVRVESVIKNKTGTISAGAGQPGGAGTECEPGVPVAGPGDDAAGVELERAAIVTRADFETNPWLNANTPLNHQASGMQAGGGKMSIVVCARHVQLAAVDPDDPFNDPSLDPVPHQQRAGRALVETNLDNPPDPNDNPVPPHDECLPPRVFDAPNHGTDEYRAFITWDRPLIEGVHGFYAYAVDANGRTQRVPPDRATVKVGMDITKPTIVAFTRNNGATCPQNGSVFCLNTPTARMLLVVNDLKNDHQGSGVISTKCAVDRTAASDPFPIACRPGENVITLQGSNARGAGAHDVDVKVTDQAGNSVTAGEVNKIAQYMVDDVKPEKPFMKLVHSGTPSNGWYRQVPELTVASKDHSPTGGFDKEGITVLIDEAENKCPEAQVGVFNEAHCNAVDTNPFMPDTGIHTFQAFATDYLGNVSETATQCEGSTSAEACTMQVDGDKPQSFFFIDRKPASGFYRTRPFWAVKAYDKGGGSGIDPDTAPSGIRAKVDAMPDDDDHYDPTDDTTNRLAEGRHKVCFFAVDVADNREAGECSQEYVVDLTPPTTGLIVIPGAPQSNGFYTAPPTVIPLADEVVPTGIPAADASGLDRAQYQLDGGPWEALAPFTVPEGRHEVRVRASDKAGNAATLTERVITVDTKKPSVALTSFPPQANALGYFRQPLQQTITGADPKPASGLAGASYQVDGGTLIDYVRAFAVGHGLHMTSARVRDRASWQSDPATLSYRVDTHAPVPKIALPAPSFSNGSAPLRYDVSDQLTPKVRINVLVYDGGSNLVRRLSVPGEVAGGTGSVSWDGRRADGSRPLLGSYHYRVQAVDQAGNSAISSQSAQFSLPVLRAADKPRARARIRVSRLVWHRGRLAVHVRCTRGAGRCRGVVRVHSAGIRVALRAGAARTYRVRMTRRPARRLVVQFENVRRRMRVR